MPTSSRKHVCKICSNTYAKAEHLIRHERTHTGDKPFACPWCYRKFSRQDSLARHQQRQGHDGSPPAQPIPEHPNLTTDTINPTHTAFDASFVQNTAGIPSQNFLDDSANAAIPPQSFDGVLHHGSAEDFFLPLTWPDSEELLQSILTSNLAPWSENIDLLPTQHMLHTPSQTIQDNDSPWLSSNTQQHTESGSQAIRNVSQIISELSANVTSEAESAVLSTVFLDACLHMFFDQFGNILPVCHRPTFIFRDWTHPLLLNSIALGSLFVGHRLNAAKGEVLWKLAHTAVATSWHSLILHCGPYDPCNGIQLVLTALLGQTYAMLSGTARLRSTAQIFHSLGFYWARKCDMFSFRRKFKPDDAINADSEERRIELWKAWAAEEVELRALLGHYILDGQLPYFTGAPTCQRHASNPLPLPCSEDLFGASTSVEWISQLKQERKEPTTFRQLLLAIFSRSSDVFGLDSRLSLLTVKVILEGLESFVSEANSVEGAVVGSPSNIAISIALGSLHNYITSSKHFSLGEITELLLRWHIVSVDAAVNINNLSRNMCSQFGVDQCVFGQMKNDENLMDLKKWTDTPHARRALLHAEAVWVALADLPLSQAHAIHMPITIFTAATVYCAFILAGITTVTLPSNIQWNFLMSIDLNDTTAIHGCSDSMVRSFLLGSGPLVDGHTKNLLYDCNVFLMYLRHTKRPWGICTSFESIVQHWLAKCGI